MSDALINGLAGACGGIIAQIITYLLRTVATLQQTERDLKKERRRIGTLEQIFQLVKQEGWERLYGGLLPSLVGTAASPGVCYYFYQIFRKKVELSAVEQRKKGIGNGTVGMLAGRPSQELTHEERQGEAEKARENQLAAVENLWASSPVPADTSNSRCTDDEEPS